MSAQESVMDVDEFVFFSVELPELLIYSYLLFQKSMV